MIDNPSKRPVYHQIADGIRAAIAGGRLTAGQVLPPVRQMAMEHGVNLNTVAAAYRELEREGLVTIRHGSGATVNTGFAGYPDEELRRSLRGVLIQMVLARKQAQDILRMVEEELSGIETPREGETR